MRLFLHPNLITKYIDRVIQYLKFGLENRGFVDSF